MSKHISVLLNEAINMLNIKEGGTYVDGTLGRGGHSEQILKRLGHGNLYCFDLDLDAIEESKERLHNYSNVVFIHDNYKNMFNYVAKVDGIILDLGVSSPQFDETSRGFSYRFNAPLDMRMNKEDKISAFDIINTYSKERLEHILKDYGEEKYYRNIVFNIIKKREEEPIKTTFELVDLIKKSLPYKVLNTKGHPAKQTFQAIRIEVNHELDSLKTFLNSFEGKLNNDGRVAIITFHSLEDKLVKYKFKELSTIKDDLRIAKLPNEIKIPDYSLLSKKAIVATSQELNDNPRSKSAKLRGIKYGKNI